MTPCLKIAQKAGIAYQLHEYLHDTSRESYGAEAAEKLGVPEERLFKTLIVSLDNRDLVVGLVPVSSMLNMERIAKAAGAKKAGMAASADMERSTGYVLGGVSPLGQKKKLQTIKAWRQQFRLPRDTAAHLSGRLERCADLEGGDARW